MDVPPDAVHADAHQLRNLRIRPVQVKLELNRYALALGQFADGHAHPIQFLGQDDLSFRVVPAGYLADDRVRHVQELAVATYKVLGCSGVARVDVMLDEAGKGYVLEANTVPGMTATSLVPKAAAAVGISFPDLCEKILLSASLNDK